MISKTRKQGESLITTIPKEVAHVLSVEVGAELSWQRTQTGYHITVHTPDLAEDMAAFRKAKAQINPVLKALADYDRG
jgi:antitoxin component of MazEF toxin-antitoxin module